MFIALIAMISSGFAFSLEIIDSNPSPVEVGEYADITIRVTNTGSFEDDKENVMVNVLDNEYFKQVSRKDEQFSFIFGRESFTKTMRVYFSEELKEGYVNIPFEIIFSTENRDNVRQVIEEEIFVEGSQENPIIEIGDVETVPGELIPDTKDNELKITLLNLGEKDAELLRAKIISKSDYAIESKTYSFSDMISNLSGSSSNDVEFSFDLLEGARDVVDFDLMLTYRVEKSNEGQFDFFNKTIPFSLTVEKTPYLVVKNVEMIDSFSIGSIENKMMVTIENIGDETAEDVRVRLKPDVSQPFIFEQLSEYVSANIKPGESANVIFTAEVLTDANVVDYELMVEVESMVESSRYSQDDSVLITVTEGEKTDYTSIAYYVIGAILVVSIFIGFTTYRKNKKLSNSRKNSKKEN